jgi:hypothetical protein
MLNAHVPELYRPENVKHTNNISITETVIHVHDYRSGRLEAYQQEIDASATEASYKEITDTVTETA